MGTGVGTKLVSDSSKLIEGPLTKEIIGAAIEVHRHLGAGLLNLPMRSACAMNYPNRRICFNK